MLDFLEGVWDKFLDKGTDFGIDKAFEKIEGVPSPLSGTQLGQMQNEYWRAAYPGVDQWSRLGAQGAAQQIQAKTEERKTQLELQKRDLANKKEVAKIAADAQVTSARAPYSVQAQNRYELSRNRNPIDDYQRPTDFLFEQLKVMTPKIKAEAEKLAQEYHKIRYETTSAQVDAEMATFELKFQKFLSDVADAQDAGKVNLGQVLERMPMSRVMQILHMFFRKR